MLSRYILDAHCYHDEDCDISWEKCSLRQWLNSEFLNTAFTDEEQGHIKTAINENPDNVEYGTLGGSTTSDKVFVLSIPEAKKYLSLENGMGVSTDYAIARGAVSYDEYSDMPVDAENAIQVIKATRQFDDNTTMEVYFVETGNTDWYLRSPGRKQNEAAIVRNRRLSEELSSLSELISTAGGLVTFEMGGVRPVVWYKP